MRLTFYRGTGRRDWRKGRRKRKDYHRGHRGRNTEGTEKREAGAQPRVE
jgi:hypothetical protein